MDTEQEQQESGMEQRIRKLKEQKNALLGTLDEIDRELQIWEHLLRKGEGCKECLKS